MPVAESATAASRDVPAAAADDCPGATTPCPATLPSWPHNPSAALEESASAAGGHRRHAGAGPGPCPRRCAAARRTPLPVRTSFSTDTGWHWAASHAGVQHRYSDYVAASSRSEEHTSELQSRPTLVC